MKKLSVLMLIGSLTACAAQATTTLSFSADFKIALPSSVFAGATVFVADELSVKTASGQLFSGKVLSAESEQLPAGFDMQLYPQYVLKLKAVSGLSSQNTQLFSNTADEINYSFNLSDVSTEQLQGWTLYSLCKAQRCLAYVVKHKASEYILTVHANGMSKMEFTGLVKGGLYVEKS
ncbi:hypothetical protein [Rheinheimera gaetbuli]